MRKTVVELALSQGDLGALPLERALLTPRQTAAALKVSRRTLLYWTEQRGRRGPKIPFMKLGKSKRFVVADVLRMIEERKIRGGEERTAGQQAA
jgi:Helix-turn-helix domain